MSSGDSRTSEDFVYEDWTAPIEGEVEAKAQPDVDAKKAFLEKWEGRLSNYQSSLNLLGSAAEDDFAGMLQISDQGNLDEFLEDFTAMLKGLGKVDGMKRMRFSKLLDETNAGRSKFDFTGDENLPKHTLTVLEDMTGYLRGNWNDYGKRCAEFMFARLSTIVDDRYCLVVGTAQELSSFLDENRKLTYTFGQHRMKLAGFDMDKLYEEYLCRLDEDLFDLATADDDFKHRFAVFVRTNADDLPFHGRELAEYLAKQANAHRELTLPKSRYESGTAQEQIDGLVGLDRVKDTVEDLRCLALAYKRDKSRGVDVPNMRFHMLFSGNPGTGKTTVARIVARMLFELGIIPTDGLTEVTAKDLVSSSVGESAERTAGVIKRARGGVLFIDEAYSLITSPKKESAVEHGKDSLAELVKAMDTLDDLVVIMAGYQDKMRELLSVNPGLQSRIAYTFDFDDYTPEQLVDMFQRMADKSSVGISENALARLIELFAFHAKLDNFGNGRFVAQVFQRANTKRARRIERDGGSMVDEFVEEDIPTTSELLGERVPDATETKRALQNLIGLHDVKTQILDLEQAMSFRREAQKRGMHLPEQSLHMVFSGNPGTGKTTIARIVGRLLFAMDVLPSSKFVEVTARDLVSSYVGGSAEKCSEVIEQARGGVLFVDEAYSLVTDPNGQGSSHAKEALAELVKAMEDYRSSLVIIFAGYTEEMRVLLDTNPGMSSRIGYNFDFPDYSVDELVSIFEAHLTESGFELEESALEPVKAVCAYFRSVKDFGNGRFVARLMQETITQHSKQCSSESFSRISKTDIPTIEHMAQISATKVVAPRGVVDDQTRRRVAYHEVGHALCSLALGGRTDIVEITVERESHGGSLGHVLHKAQSAQATTPHELRGMIVGYLGGMAAEQVAYGSYTAGNGTDLEQATRDAVRYVACYGMSDLGFIQYVKESEEIDILKLPEHVRDKVGMMLNEAFDEACSLIEQQRAVLDEMAEELLRNETLSGDRIYAIWESRGQSV